MRRCYPHNIGNLVKQQLWYGRTALAYYRVVGKNLWLTMIRSNAVLGLIILSIALNPINIVSTAALVLMAIAVIT